MSSRFLLLVSLAALSAGCAESDASASSDNPTLIGVEPEDFLGDVPCLDSPGAMRRYVATIEDVSGELGTEDAPIDSFVLPSSPPVSCTMPVAFGFVVVDHRYVGDVDGYDRTDLEPLVPGSRIMVDPQTRDVVAPRWTTSCGRENEGTNTPVVAQSHLTVNVRGCAPLVDHLTAGSPTGVSVGLDSALGDLECGDQAGSVGRFQVWLEGSNEPALQGECGATVTFDGLLAPATYAFRVVALEGDSDVPHWSTSCEAVARSGATVGATCEPLTSTGGLLVDVPALLANAGQSCGPQAVTLVVASVPTADGARSAEQAEPECQQPLVVDGLEAGYYQLMLRTELSDGSPGPAARCEVLVEPAAVSAADCDLL